MTLAAKAAPFKMRGKENPPPILFLYRHKQTMEEKERKRIRLNKDNVGQFSGPLQHKRR